MRTPVDYRRWLDNICERSGRSQASRHYNSSGCCAWLFNKDKKNKCHAPLREQPHYYNATLGNFSIPISYHTHAITISQAHHSTTTSLLTKER